MNAALAEAVAEACAGALAGRRICLVGPLPPPAGGMANQTAQLAQLLAGEGAEVAMVRSHRPPPAWLAALRGVRGVAAAAAFLPALWRGLAAADLVHLVTNSWWAFHLYATPTVRLARARGIPVVLNYRGGEAEPFLHAHRRWALPTLRAADRIVVPSRFLAYLFAGHDLATTVVPNIVDLARFTPGEQVAEPVILVARNLEPLYGIDTAIRAVALLHRRKIAARLIVAGAGPERARLQGLAAAEGIAAFVRFTGRVDNRAMAALYAQARIALNPSRADNLPISILEAWAAGVPVVSTRVGGVPYLVDDGETGLLCPVDEPEAMAEVVACLHRDPDLYDHLRAAGLRAARGFAWPAVKSRLLAVYDALWRG